MVNARSAHIALKYFYCREKVNDKTIHVKHCAGDNMIADILTKILPVVRFERLRSMMLKGGGAIMTKLGAIITGGAKKA